MKNWACRGALSLLVAGLVASASGMTAHSAPTPDRIDDVPARTALSFMHTPSGTRVGTANQGEARPGLSIVKLYVADYMLRHGDGSPEDFALGQRMIRDSDDNAASQAYAKYPQSIDVIAAEYRLTSTRGSGFWGDAVTSTADTVTFLEAKKTTDPDSQILEWMATAAPVAADGTHQNWGTGRLPSVTGTKWGWSDYGPSIVASASFGPDFSVSANTYGTADQHTSDVLGAFVQDPTPPPQVVPDPIQDLIDRYMPPAITPR
ncbi:MULTISPECIES: hypothetical protein [unclassified Rhodococcus (in: high G+C Gram-positive bacteria)]|uniref:hypothetical protein n=1 Tax=unclassified Rhodococcus (in: high G+C Gram-positive bacteria) TaxID=192944 RepID=UPI00077ACC4E|nr:MULTISPECIES: hypothetical protein [unclassified Rhodococcus (in: high G+C Gram-positive bacteria)]KXX62207.1 hypothetical protein AZG88_30010 [Rhodococcus sp. LB1]PBC55446.1 hypothetical protein CJ177_21020 [Rhodococcus sp. ACPA1]RZK70715.1 MAG: hypothetical protein EOP25_08080 [Rhodococcus sp. (in: high G+C Gram-positive bacteria)]